MSGEEGASPRLIVTSCRVSSGRVAAAVDSGGTVVLVSQDGIQRPPFRFPKGGHLLQLLSCLENGLLPHGQLDPPLWSQRGKVSDRGGPGRQGWGSAVGSALLAFGPLCGCVGSCMPHRSPRAVQVAGQVCPRGQALGCVLSGQSIPQTAQAKPPGFIRVHVFRQGRRRGHRLRVQDHLPWHAVRTW